MLGGKQSICIVTVHSPRGVQHAPSCGHGLTGVHAVFGIQSHPCGQFAARTNVHAPVIGSQQAPG